jgi:hypothetical protein
MNRDEFGEIRRLAMVIEEAMSELDGLLKDADKHLYEQWKAYGKQVTSEFVSMGPNLPEVIDKLEVEIEDENDDQEAEQEEIDDILSDLNKAGKLES